MTDTFVNFAQTAPDIASHLQRHSTWLVTGGAGFIGSHLATTLLRHGQSVVVLDDFSTGLERNIEYIKASAGAFPNRLRVIRASVADLGAVTDALEGVQYVLHQAALGSIPRSFANPLPTDSSNVHGFLTVLDCSLRAGVRSVVFASSSSVYGDSPHLPKTEDKIGAPLSPYAISKLSNELYASVLAPKFSTTPVTGLRYFNVFGPRQNPAGAYAAVIPRWIGEMMAGKQTSVFGDGSQSRDFCFVDNVVQANIRAAFRSHEHGAFRVYNIAAGARTSLMDLHAALRQQVGEVSGRRDIPAPIHEDRRPGDIPHSLADISRANHELSYSPTHSVVDGLKITVSWYAQHPEAL